jgi:hypothetical protein
MGRGSLAGPFHYFPLEISVTLKNRGLISGTSQGVGNRWNLRMLSGFLTFRKKVKEEPEELPEDCY